MTKKKPHSKAATPRKRKPSKTSKTSKAARRKPAKRKPSKTSKTSKAARRKPAKRAPAKRAPAKRKTRKNPEKRAPSAAVRMTGKPPSPDTLLVARLDLLVTLLTGDGVRYGSRIYYPWLVRAWERKDLPARTLLWAVTEMANEGMLAIYTDDDRRPYMARADVQLCPTAGDAGELLVWLVWTDRDKAKRLLEKAGHTRLR